jgi:hypothetical protein
MSVSIVSIYCRFLIIVIPINFYMFWQIDLVGWAMPTQLINLCFLFGMTIPISDRLIIKTNELAIPSYDHWDHVFTPFLELIVLQLSQFGLMIVRKFESSASKLRIFAFAVDRSVRSIF